MNELATELRCEIFSYVDELQDIHSLILTCTNFRDIILAIKVADICTDDTLYYMIEDNKVATVKQLLKLRKWNEENLCDILDWACENGHVEIIHILVTDHGVDPSDGGNSPLLIAGGYGQTEVIRLLLSYTQVDPNAEDSNGYDVLTLACFAGRTEIVQLLLDDPRFDLSRNGGSAIYEASKNGHAEVVLLLLDDPRLDLSRDSDDAICVASANGHAEVVRLLLTDDRVDPSARDNDAIYEASKYGHIDVVRILLADERVDATARNNYALDIARRRGHHEVVRLLKKW